MSTGLKDQTRSEDQKMTKPIEKEFKVFLNFSDKNLGKSTLNTTPLSFISTIGTSTIEADRLINVDFRTYRWNRKRS